MVLVNIISLVAGIALILFGADRLTEGAAGLARRFHVTEMVIGLTVVAFGTSLPEFMTSFVSLLHGSSDLSIGNIIGSNIFNVLMIVGCTAMVCPIVISRSTLLKDIPFSLLASLVLAIVCLDTFLNGKGNENVLSRSDGLLMLGFFCVFMAYTFSISHKRDAGQEESVVQMPYWKMAVFIAFGIAGLVVGGNLFVKGASEIALKMGVSETIIGLTLVAAGTSLPELATSIVAARKGQSAMAIGNVIGSCIFNVFFILGLCASAIPMPVGEISYVDLLVMLFSVLMLWSFAYTKRTIERWEGFMMFFCYMAYMAYLVYDTCSA